MVRASGSSGSRERKRRVRPAHPGLDREDYVDTTPQLEEDFRHPCPSCEKELVILASQPIRRVRCSDCREEFTLDRRIGGALCLLPFNAKVYAGHRALVERLKNLTRRGVVYVVAAVVAG